MQNFDFVKFTLIFALVLTLAAAGCYVWLGAKVEEAEADLRRSKDMLSEIGTLAGDIHLLEKEMRNDKAEGKEAATYFQEQARYARIDANRDYRYTPRDSEVKRGYKDTEFILDFKGKGDLSRDQLFAFVFNVETQSPRVKLVKANLRLDEKVAERDLWGATLTFLRRDPYSDHRE
jgi:hypothetical protein